jgi:hypothetical protein
VPGGTRGHPRVLQDFAYWTLTICGRPFHAFLLSFHNPFVGAPQPRAINDSVWAVPRSLATTYGISIDFYSCRYLDVSVPCVRLVTPMYSVHDTWTLLQVGSPIRKSPDQSLLAAPRSLSQLTASFIASRYPGILRLPLVA